MCGLDRWQFETRHQVGVRGALAAKWEGGREINLESGVADTPSHDPNGPHPCVIHPHECGQNLGLPCNQLNMTKVMGCYSHDYAPLSKTPS